MVHPYFPRREGKEKVEILTLSDLLVAAPSLQFGVRARHPPSITGFIASYKNEVSFARLVHRSRIRKISVLFTQTQLP
jgi:hypothetical protein